MKRLGVFITKDELDGVLLEKKCSGMFLPGGAPMGDPGRRVADLCKKYNVPEGAGLDPENGEFCSP